jgi:bleomycin hydrolase
MSTSLDYQHTVSTEWAAEQARRFQREREHRSLMNAIKKNGIQAVAMDQAVATTTPHTFSLELKSEPITNQKQSGRCWAFAGFNLLKASVCAKHNLKEFELSQAYQMFWDKIEKANYFLENVLATADEPMDSEVVRWVFRGPAGDGGYWAMFVDLVEKYGVVPKTVMPETFHSSQSKGMNDLLALKLGEQGLVLRRLYTAGAGTDALLAEKASMLSDIYRMLVHFLGEPPTAFDWEYRDRDDAFHAVYGLTPQTFFAEHVGVDLGEYVTVINSPLEDTPYDQSYTVRFGPRTKGGRDVLYLNVDMDTMRRLTLAQLQDGEPVWFACDVGKASDRDSGVLDTALYNYDTTLGVAFGMNKAERLQSRASSPTHAMLITGVNLVDGRPNRWKVENSWGTDRGHKGWFVMSDEWFGEYTYHVIVQRKHLSENLRRALEAPPRMLKLWNPVGDCF